MQYAISHDGESYADHPYYASEEQAYKEGRDRMWEAGLKRLYIAEVNNIVLNFPFTPESVTAEMARVVEETFEGLGQNWYKRLPKESEDKLKSYLDLAVQKWATECGVSINEDVYTLVGNYNLEII